jgi:sulfur carrier protein
MKILLNGKEREIEASTLKLVLEECGYAEAVVATAVNGKFVPKTARVDATLREGDRLEVLAPMQGG